VINIVIATGIHQLPALCPRRPAAEANVRARGQAFVEAARLSGNGRGACCCWGHVLPNIMPIMMVQMSLTMGYAILNAAGLSFIGPRRGGRRPPEMGHHGRRGRQLHPERRNGGSRLFPGAALMLAVFCFNLLGDGLRDIIDPLKRNLGASHMTAVPALAVEDLSVEFRTRSGHGSRCSSRWGSASTRARPWRWWANRGSGKSVTAFRRHGHPRCGRQGHLGPRHVRRPPTF